VVSAVKAKLGSAPSRRSPCSAWCGRERDLVRRPTARPPVAVTVSIAAITVVRERCRDAILCTVSSTCPPLRVNGSVSRVIACVVMPLARVRPRWTSRCPTARSRPVIETAAAVLSVVDDPRCRCRWRWCEAVPSQVVGGLAGVGSRCHFGLGLDTDRDLHTGCDRPAHMRRLCREVIAVLAACRTFTTVADAIRPGWRFAGAFVKPLRVKSWWGYRSGVTLLPVVEVILGGRDQAKRVGLHDRRFDD